MIIRKAEQKDNADLLHLSQQAVQEGVVSYYADHSPDFFSLLHAMGDDYTLWVAEDENEICGCIGEFGADVLFNGKKCRRVYIGELKVLPKSRGMLAFSLGFHMGKKIEQSDYDLGLGFILDGNVRSKKLSEFIVKKYVSKTQMSWVNSYQLLPIKKYKEYNQYTVRVAKKDDVPILLTLLKNQYASYNCSPVFSESWLEKECLKTPSFTIENFRIAELNGQPVACAAFWDQSDIRKTIVNKFSVTIQAAIIILKMLKPFYSIPKFPKEGESLKYQYLRFPAAADNHMEALTAIVNREINLLGKDPRFHFLWASFHEADPLINLVNDIKKIKTKTHMYAATLSDRLSEEPSHQLTYIDFSLI